VLLHSIKVLASVQFGKLKQRTHPKQAHIHLARAKLLAIASRAFEAVDFQRTLYNALLALREARRCSDSVWQTRALGFQGLLRCCSLLHGGVSRGLDEIERACSEASRLGDRSARCDLFRSLAVAHYASGNFAAALQAAARCELDTRSLPLPPRETYYLMNVVTCILWELGELREAQRRWAAFSDEVRNQGDALVQASIHVSPLRFALLVANDNHAGIRAILERQRQLSAHHSAFKVLSWNHAFCRAEASLYLGAAESALEHVERDWKILAGVGYPIYTAWALTLRARAALAVASRAQAGRRRVQLLRSARRDAQRMRRTDRRPIARANCDLLLAGCALLRGEGDAARRHVSSALSLYGQGSKVNGAVARWCLGSLIQGEIGEQLQTDGFAQLRAEGVVDVERWVAWTMPGFLERRGIHVEL
jgi:hypothetical protein